MRDSEVSEIAELSPEYVHNVLEGVEVILKLGEAAAILARAGHALEAIEPLASVATVVVMAADLWDAFELPERTCLYQGLCYGLMYTVLGMGDPAPNAGWPSRNDAPEVDAKFRDGVAEAKRRLADGRQCVKATNLLLLAIAKDGEKKLINKLWQAAIAVKDHLLKMFTIEWPQVAETPRRIES